MTTRSELMRHPQFSDETDEREEHENGRIETLGQIWEWILECRMRGGKWHGVKALLDGYLRDVAETNSPDVLRNVRISFVNRTYEWVKRED